MSGISDLPSLRLRDINQDLLRQHPQHKKLKDSHYGIGSQRKITTEPLNIRAFTLFLRHWAMPWDPQTESFFDFDHFQSLRDQAYEAPKISVPNSEEEEPVALTVEEIQLLKKDRYKIWFRGEYLNLGEIIEGAHEQGITKEKLIQFCGFREWQNIQAHLRRKKSWRSTHEIIAGAQRMQFENFMEKLTQDDVYLQLELNTMLTLEFQGYQADKSAWEAEISEKQSLLRELEKELDTCEKSIELKKVRKKRLSLNRAIDLRAGKAASEENEKISLITAKIADLKQQILVISQDCSAESIASAKQAFEEKHKILYRHQQELKFYDLRKQADTYRYELSIIESKDMTDFPEDKKAKLKQHELRIKSDLAKLLPTLQSLSKELEIDRFEREESDPEYRQFSINVNHQHYWDNLRDQYPDLRTNIDLIRNRVKSQGNLLNYTVKELHQHFRLRVQPFHQYLTVTKKDFEARVSRTLWGVLLNLLKNIWYGRIPPETELTFRQRYSLCKQESQLQLRHWAQAALTRFEAHLACTDETLAAQYEYSDVALNTYRSLEQVGIPMPTLSIVNDDSPHDREARFKIEPRKDLEGEDLIALRDDLKQYIKILEQEIETLERKKQKVRPGKHFEYMSYEDYEHSIQELRIERDNILERMQNISCLSKPEWISESEFEREQWLHEPKLLFILNTIEQDLSRIPSVTAFILDQLDHRGQPRWSRSATIKLNALREWIDSHQDQNELRSKKAFETIREKYEAYCVLLNRDNEASKYVTAKQDAIKNMMTRLGEQALTTEDLIRIREQCRRADLQLKNIDYETLEYFLPELVPFLVETIANGALLTPEGEFNVQKAQQIVLIARTCLSQDDQDGLIELMKSLSHPNEAYDRLELRISLLIDEPSKKQALIKQCVKHYYFPEFQKTLDFDLGESLRRYDPPLIDDFYHAHQEDFQLALRRTLLLLEKQRQLGELLPMTAVKAGWELYDESLRESSLKWLTLAEQAGQLTRNDKQVLESAFRAYVHRIQVVDSSEYHALFTLDSVPDSVLRAYWLKRCMHLMNSLDLPEEADRIFLNQIAARRPAIYSEIKNQLIALLKKDSLNKGRGLFNLALIHPGEDVRRTLAQIYEREFTQKKFHHCQYLQDLRDEAFSTLIDHFHAQRLRNEILGLEFLDDPSCSCIGSTDRGQLQLSQAASTQLLMGYLQLPDLEALDSLKLLAEKTWLDAFGPEHLELIFDYLELAAKRPLPFSILAGLQILFSTQQLAKNKESLPADAYLRYHAIIQSIQGQIEISETVNNQQAALSSFKAEFLRFCDQEPHDVFSVLSAGLKEPYFLSRCLEYARDYFISMEQGENKARVIEEFFERLNRPDLSAIDFIEPYRTQARQRLQYDLKSVPDNIMTLFLEFDALLSEAEPRWQEFFLKERDNLSAIKFGKHLDELTRASLFNKVNLAQLKAQDPIHKSLLKAYAKSLAAPYEGLTEYQTALSLFYAYSQERVQLDRRLEAAQKNTLVSRNLKLNDHDWPDLHKELFETLILHIPQIQVSPVAQLNRAMAVLEFVIRNRLSSTVIERAKAQLFDQLRSMVVDPNLPNNWWSKEALVLRDALAQFLLPEEQIDFVLQCDYARELYQTYLRNFQIGNLRELSFEPAHARLLAQSLPEAAKQVLVDSFYRVLFTLEKSSPTYDLLLEFLALLDGENINVSQPLFQAFNQRRFSVEPRLALNACIDSLGKNRLLDSDQHPEFISDLLFHVDDNQKITLLLALVDRIDDWVTNKKSLTGLNSLESPSPRMMDEQIHQVLKILKASRFIPSPAASYQNAEFFYAMQFIAAGFPARVLATTYKNCQALFGQRCEFHSIVPEQERSSLTHTIAWSYLATALNPSDPAPTNAREAYSVLYHYFIQVILPDLLTNLLKLMSDQLKLSYTNNIDPQNWRTQAYEARFPIESLLLIYRTAKTFHLNAVLDSLSQIIQDFRIDYLRAVKENRPIPCGEYYGVLVLGYFDHLTHQSTVQRLMNIKPELFETYEAREQLTYLDWKEKEGYALSEADRCIQARAESIKNADDEQYQYFMQTTLRSCRESELITQYLQSHESRVIRRNSMTEHEAVVEKSEALTL